jgi:hypothetical protein
VDKPASTIRRRGLLAFWPGAEYLSRSTTVETCRSKCGHRECAFMMIGLHLANQDDWGGHLEESTAKPCRSGLPRIAKAYSRC